MARKRPEDRLQQLITAATEVFIARGGYERTQMEDVAAAMGIAKGTLYLYVQSKEALFDLVFRYADAPEEAGDLADRSFPIPAPGALMDHVAARIDAEQRMGRLGEALGRETVADPAAELEGIVREIYETLHRNRRAMKLIGVSALDMPALAELWFKGARRVMIERLGDYFALRARSGLLREMPDPVVAARMVIETVSWFAVHRYWDRDPQEMEESVAEETVVRALVAAFAKERP